MNMKVAVVIPNLNGEKYLQESLTSLLEQSYPCKIIVVDNASSDKSVEIVRKNKDVQLIENTENLGFAGGVNTGIRYALDNGFDAVALFNNDAIAKKDWLEQLVKVLDDNKNTGIITCFFQKIDKKHIDSTGDIYTSWGLPYPRDRDLLVSETHRTAIEPVFGASGGASLYRASMLRKIGLFDEDFFAYYEDIDISFRAQLAGYKILFTPKAVAFHIQGATSSKISGFATYQTFKNYPLILVKNVPRSMFLGIYIRFSIAYLSIFISSSLKGNFVSAFKGWLMFVRLFPKKLKERRTIQRTSVVDKAYLKTIITNDLPPDAKKLRTFRRIFTFGIVK